MGMPVGVGKIRSRGVDRSGGIFDITGATIAGASGGGIGRRAHGSGDTNSMVPVGG